MKDRIKQIRQSVGISQAVFAEKIGLSRNYVAMLEIGQREPSDRTISDICREFHVREEWLRTGEGEMFAPTPTTALDALAQEQKLNHGEYILIEKLFHLKPEVRQGILGYILEVAAALNSDDVPADTPAMPEMSAAELHAELDRQLNMEKEATAKSEVS